MEEQSILLILPAHSFNEQEYTNIKNSFEKSNFKIFIASDSHSLCIGNNGLRVRADVSFFNMHEKNFTAIVFIGGEGVMTYFDNSKLHAIAKAFNKNNKPIGAICGAPVILAKAGLLSGVEATCYQPLKKELEKAGSLYQDKSVVLWGNFVTAQHPSSADEFAAVIKNQIAKRFASV